MPLDDKANARSPQRRLATHQGAPAGAAAGAAAVRTVALLRGAR
jgi:hypothetical protein